MTILFLSIPFMLVGLTFALLPLVHSIARETKARSVTPDQVRADAASVRAAHEGHSEHVRRATAVATSSQRVLVDA